MRAGLKARSVTLIASLSASTATFAGDAATLNILGFSPDGVVFAFEEYGVQDGSGFPYANRFYINTETDNFIEGSPIRVRIDDESASIDDVREQAKAQGELIETDVVLNAHRGFTAGSNAITEMSADPHRMMVNPRPVNPPIDAPLELRLREIPFAATGTCNGLMDQNVGFSLTHVALNDGQATRLLHEDTAVPSSRGCPLGYTLGAIQTYYPEGGAPVFATMIAVRTYGFEGPDFRWMAVTAHIEP